MTARGNNEPGAAAPGPRFISICLNQRGQDPVPPSGMLYGRGSGRHSLFSDKPLFKGRYSYRENQKMNTTFPTGTSHRGRTK